MNGFLLVGLSLVVLTAVLAFARALAERDRAKLARASHFPPPVPWADAFADVLQEAGVELVRFAARRGIIVCAVGGDVFVVHEVPHPVCSFRVAVRGHPAGAIVEVLLDDVQMRFLRAYRGYPAHTRDGFFLSLCAAALEMMDQRGSFWTWTDGQGYVHRSDLRILQGVDDVAVTPDTAGDRVLARINKNIDKKRGGGNGA